MRMLTPLALAGLLVLAGCGLRGGLDRPGPLFGEEAAAQKQRDNPDQVPNRQAPAEMSPGIGGAGDNSTDPPRF